MGKIKSGLFGQLSGRVGNVIYSSWRGTQVVKKLPAPRQTGPSPAQLEQQTKFRLLMNFFTPLTPVLNKAFEKSNLRMTGLNKAVSNNKDRLTGRYPDIRIDYAEVILCKDILQKADVITVTAGSEGKLNFKVDKNVLYDMRGPSALFFIAAYEEELNRWIYKMNPVLSDDYTCELDLSPFHSKSVHTYAGIMPSYGRCTTSLYTGIITVP